MTTTTTTPAAPTVSVVMASNTLAALTENAQRMRTAADTFREALTPAYLMAERATRDTYALASGTERVQQMVTASTRALRGLTSSAHFWPALDHHGTAVTAALYGRSEEIARLGRDARKIARGNTRVSVSVARYLSFLHDHGRTYTADLAALAFRGDLDARREWESMAEAGDPDALVVVTILQEIDGMRADAEHLAAEVAALVASVTLTDLPDTAEPLPPPRITLTGSLDLHAPPVASPSATAGNVLTANGSPMR